MMVWYRNRKAFLLATVCILAISLAGLLGCPTGQPNGTTPPQPPGGEDEPTPTPLTVDLEYIGVKAAHGGSVQLITVVSDGDKIAKYAIPPFFDTFTMDEFETQRIGQILFNTRVAKGDLKINILAYHREQSQSIDLTLIEMSEWYSGDGIGQLIQLVEATPGEELIGYYENTWSPDESWGIGEYNEVGSGDLRVWFSIWSDTAPEPILEPRLLPDVTIQEVSLPTEVVRTITEQIIPVGYATTLTLFNHETFGVTVDWQGHSSLTGILDSGSVNMPAESTWDIRKGYYYETSGTHEMTYTVSYNRTVLDTWTGTLEVID